MTELAKVFKHNNSFSVAPLNFVTSGGINVLFAVLQKSSSS